MDKSTKWGIGIGAFVLLLLLPKKTNKMQAVELIKKFEGYRGKAYQDSVGVWTIGYGTTLNVKPTDVITPVQAESFLKRDMGAFEKVIKESVKVPLTDNQFSALTSLVYNIGPAAFKKSTLLKKINAKAPIHEIEPHFLAWRNAGGKPILLSRRIQEFEVFKG